MDIYVGLMDYDCYMTLKEEKAKEVNSWRPGNTSFKALHQDELFLFKLKKPFYAIVGGGYFVSYSKVPIDTAWKIFQEKNGIRSEIEFKRRIGGYQQKRGIESETSNIGCIALTDTFFFEPDEWIKSVDDWSDSIVTGKKYDENSEEGKRIVEEVLKRLRAREAKKENGREIESLRQLCLTHEQGEGAFEMLVMDTYNRSCAITGEKILPILKPVHIRPLADGGSNQVNNGLLLRNDLAALFEKGYLTVDEHYTVHVSPQLAKEYGENKTYEVLEGKDLMILPNNMLYFPDRESLAWHGENIYKK